MKTQITCPHCNGIIEIYKNPLPTVDVILYNENKEVLLIKRKNPPYGWAIPGGFVDVGETVEQAARREIEEEVGLKIYLQGIFGVYSSPDRDPRHHTITTVFYAKLPSENPPQAGDDAAECKLFSLTKLPDMAFDHKNILQDFLARFDKLTSNFVKDGRSVFI